MTTIISRAWRWVFNCPVHGRNPEDPCYCPKAFNTKLADRWDRIEAIYTVFDTTQKEKDDHVRNMIDASKKWNTS